MRTLAIAAVCLAAAVAGCSGGGGAPRPAATATATPAATVEAGMRHNRFLPRRLVVRLGQTVRWTNRDAVAHTVASQDLRLASEAIRGGETFSYRPRRAGRFAYFCTIHAGQNGVLIVR